MKNYQSLPIAINLIIAAAFVMATAGCLTRSVEANNVTVKERQFLMWSNIRDFTIETNGAVHVGSYIVMADTNGMEKIADIVSAAVAAAVKAGLVSGLMMQSQNAAYSEMPLGRTTRVKSFNGKPGPYDVQIVPVTEEPEKVVK